MTAAPAGTPSYHEMTSEVCVPFRIFRWISSEAAQIRTVVLIGIAEIGWLHLTVIDAGNTVVLETRQFGRLPRSRGKQYGREPRNRSKQKIAASSPVS
jgi:hypothetical protein